MSDKSGDILLIAGFLIGVYGWLKLRMQPKGRVEFGPVTMVGEDGTVYSQPTQPAPSAPFTADFASSLFSSFMPSMTPPAQVSTPAAVPEVISLADARTLAKSVINKHFSGRVDLAMVTAMIEIESGYRRTAYRYERHLDDASYGLMQVLYKTAKWLHDDLKYRGYSLPNGDAMYDAATGIYFGCAYIDWLRKHPRSNGTEDWIVMSYNGGPGADNSMTRNHLSKYHAAKARQAQVK